MNQLDAIVSIASDLTAALSSEERYRRLLDALRRVIPYDAAALLRLEDGELLPIVSEGLSDDAMGRRFPLKEHPRLEIICRSDEPVMFPSDSNLPDPYDGLLADDRGEFKRIHACLGCPLRVGDELIGALTADAAEPHAFEGIESGFLAAVGALAAAELRTTHLIEALERSAERQGLIARDLMRDVELRQGSDMIGTTQVMQRLRQDIELVARSDFTVLITGETGVGKELVARAVHNASERRAEPMLYVNCAALPETLADSELFGHMRGAFTGASSDRAGKFEVASGGTLFLDEIGELPLSVQPKLLRAIQDKCIRRLGSTVSRPVDFRLVAATNRNLESMVAEGTFREDLYYRLSAFTIAIPPLRNRRDDIPGLVMVALREAAAVMQRPVPEVSEAVMAKLQSHPWPRNVRQLFNVVERALVLEDSLMLHEQAFPQLFDLASPPSAPPTPRTLTPRPSAVGAEVPLPQAPSVTFSPSEPPSSVRFDSAVMEMERRLLLDALERCDGNQTRAAELLAMPRRTFVYKLKRHGIRRGANHE